MEKKTRQQMIDWLIENDTNGDGWFDLSEKEQYLKLLLREGFIGYNNMTNEDLEHEIYERSEQWAD